MKQSLSQFESSAAEFALHQAQEGTFTDELLRSAAYSSAEGPVLGLTQLADSTTGSNLSGLAKETFLSRGIVPPTPNPEFLSPTWWAQNIGNAIGMTVPVVLAGLASRAALGRRLPLSEPALSERAMLKMTVKEAAATGLVYGSLLTPTPGENNIVIERLESGGAMAASFGFLAGTSHSLSKVSFLRNPIAAGIASGIPGGLANAEIEAWKDGRTSATLEEIGHSIISLSSVGGIFGVKGMWRQRATLQTSPPAVEASAFKGLTDGHFQNISIAESAVERLPQKRELSVAGTAGESAKFSGVIDREASPLEPLPQPPGDLASRTGSSEANNLRPAPPVPHQLIAEILAAQTSAARMLEWPAVSELLQTRLAEAKPLPPTLRNAVEFTPTIPTATSLWNHEGALSAATWRLGSIVRDAESKTTTVWDAYNETARVFDADGQVISATVKRGSQINHQQYIKDEQNSLRAVLLGPDHGWFKTPDGWAESRGASSSGKLTLLAAEFEHAAIDPDAGFFLGQDEQGFSIPLNGRYRRYNETKSWVELADPEYEQRLSRRLMGRLDGPTQDKIIDAFVKTDLKHVGGHAALWAEFNRELTNGDIKALDLLETAAELLNKPNISSLSLSRNLDNHYQMTASGYNYGDHVTYHPDETKISLRETRRSILLPDGSSKDLMESGHEYHWQLPDRFSNSYHTPTGKLERKIELGESSRIRRVEQVRGGQKDILENSKEGWVLIQSYGSRTEQRILGSGTVKEQGLGQSVTFSQEGSPDKITLDTTEAVRRTNADGSQELLLPGVAELVNANAGQAKANIVEFARNGGGEHSDRLTLLKAINSLTKSVQYANLPESAQAILLAEINRQIEINPQRATALAQDLNTRFKSEISPDIAIRREKTQSSIRIGNDAILLANDGSPMQTAKVLFQNNDRLDENFTDRLSQALAHVSPNILNLVSNNGSRVVPVERLSASLNDVKLSERPQGWPAGTTHEHLDGYFDRSTRRIFIPHEHKITLKDESSWITNGSPEHSLLHTLAYAVDESLNGFSQSHLFERALSKDRLLADKHISDQYTDSAVDKQRLFADIFASIHRRALSEEQDAALKSSYPHTRIAISQRLTQAGKEQAVFEDSQTSKQSQEQLQPVDEHPDFQKLLRLPARPSKEPSAQARLELAASAFPPATGPATTLIDGTQLEPWKHGSIVYYPDDTTDVINTALQTTASYNSSGRLTEATANLDGEIRSQRFIYDRQDDLRAIIDSHRHSWLKAGQRWSLALQDAPGELTLVPMETEIFAHPAGGYLSDNETAAVSKFPNKRSTSISKRDTSTDLVASTPAYEQGVAKRLAQSTIESIDTRQHMIESLDKFADLAEKNNARPHDVAEFYAEVSRLLLEAPSGVPELIAATNSRMESGGYSRIFVRAGRSATLSSIALKEGREGVDDSFYHMDGTREEKNGSILTKRYTDGSYEHSDESAKGMPTLRYSPDDKLTTLVYDDDEKSFKRSFAYSTNGNLQEISDSRPDGTKISWRSDGHMWTRSKTDSQGLEVTESVEHATIELSEDGTVTLHSADQPGQSRVLTSAGEEELHTPDNRVQVWRANGRTFFTGANLEHESALLHEKLSDLASQFNLSPERTERLHRITDQFLSGATGRGTSNTFQALTLLNLNRLLSSNQEAVLSVSQRLNLAEQITFLLADAVRTKQGAHPTCNAAVVQHRLAVLAPDKLVQALADVTVNGKYIYDDGGSTEIGQLSKMLEPDSDAVANITIQEAGQDKISADGTRTWASQILQSVLVHAAWLDKDLYVRGDRRLGEYSLGLIKDIDSNETKLVEFDTSLLQPLNPKRIDHHVVTSMRGDLIGALPAGKYTAVRNERGQWLKDLAPGSTGFDQNGKPLFSKAAAGDVSFGRRLGESEHLLLRRGGNHEPMRFSDGSFDFTPSISIFDLDRLYRMVAGDDGSKIKFVITPSYFQSDTVASISSPEQLGVKLQELKEANQLPGILFVHTRHSPFRHWYGGVGHVVNIYDYNPTQESVRFSNQWMDANNYMDESGIPIQVLYNAMMEPLQIPDSAANVAPIPMVDRKLFNWLKLGD